MQQAAGGEFTPQRGAHARPGTHHELPTISAALAHGAGELGAGVSEEAAEDGEKEDD